MYRDHAQIDSETAAALVDLAVADLRAWVGRNAPRSVARRALDVWQHDIKLNERQRDRVLEYFDADPDPKPGLDYLPQPEPTPQPAFLRELVAERFGTRTGRAA